MTAWLSNSDWGTHFWIWLWHGSVIQALPLELTAMPTGSLKLSWPGPGSLAPKLARKTPVVLSFWTRPLPWSATKTLPAESASIASGCLNSPLPDPSLPKAPTKEKVEVHSSTRLLPVSATQSEPSGATATEVGSLSWPSFVPGVPKLARIAPLGLNFSTRPLPFSTTKRFPPEETAMPIGSFIWPSSSPAVPAWQTFFEAAVQRFFSAWVPPLSTLVLLTLVPKVATNSPFSLNSSTRVLPVSVTQMLPLGSITIPEGELSLPPVEPREPNAFGDPPPSVNCSIRLLALSTTQRMPLESIATSAGWLSWPVAEPDSPKAEA